MSNEKIRNAMDARDALGEARETVDTVHLFLDGLGHLADEGSIPDDGVPMRTMATMLFEASQTMLNVEASLGDDGQPTDDAGLRAEIEASHERESMLNRAITAAMASLAKGSDALRASAATIRMAEPEPRPGSPEERMWSMAYALESAGSDMARVCDRLDEASTAAAQIGSERPAR